MEHRPRICKNCVYYDGNKLKPFCIYWRSRIGPMVMINGCDEFEDEDYWESVTGL